MGETRKIAAILVADVVGYSRLAGADEDRILARLRTLRSDLIDPTIAVHHGRIVKRTGDGAIVEFRSVVDAVRYAIEVQNGMAERNGGLPPERRIELRVGIHLGDVVEESDGDLMGDGVNIAARLEGIAKPGAICLSEDAYRQVKGRLDLAVTDLGPTQLKNIAEPIRVYSLEVGQPAQAKPSPFAPEKSNPPRLSIVVLPFANMGGDPEQEYFVDGITGSLTTDLSRISGSFVIARNTAFTYKGKAVDLKQIGRELNVRYVLEGSVQRSRERMRINVQLVDVESGNHLWAERFDKPLADLFEMQDEVVVRLASQLSAELVSAEARRAGKSPNLDAYDLYFQGMAWLNRGTSHECSRHARSFFARALEIDPDHVDALIGSTHADIREVYSFEASERLTVLAAAEASLSRALSLSLDNAGAHLALSHVKSASNRPEQGLVEAELALALGGNVAQALQAKANAKLFSGFAEQAVECHLQVLRLSPRDPFVSNAIGAAKLHLGEYEEARNWLGKSVVANPNYAMSHFFLAAALGQLGRIKEAHAEKQVGLALNPTFTISRFRDDAESDNPVFLKQRHNIYDGLRKAGMPEERSKSEGSLRERVRCSPLVDWPVYPRLRGTMQASTRARNASACGLHVGVEAPPSSTGLSADRIEEFTQQC
jgi:TolB-like protein/class 3 adenylate cyclase/Flp pilus assembly protein TadD